MLDYKSASDRFASLRAALGEGLVELVHGQMPAPEKDAAMARFQSGDAKVLVATTVIEVGVNVPQASIMVIERAEAFGLAQLHQLRGRVGRGTQKSTCLLLYQAPLSAGGKKRLEIKARMMVRRSPKRICKCAGRRLNRHGNLVCHSFVSQISRR